MMCGLPSLFSDNTALCRCAIYLKQHIGTVEHCRLVTLKSTHFCRCIVVE